MGAACIQNKKVVFGKASYRKPFAATVAHERLANGEFRNIDVD